MRGDAGGGGRGASPLTTCARRVTPWKAEEMTMQENDDALMCVDGVYFLFISCFVLVLFLFTPCLFLFGC